MEGIGVYTVPNICNYNGDFSQNKANGYGVLKWNDGREYRGTFKNNKFNGNGKFTHKNRTYHKGIWKMGKLDGPGKQKLIDRSIIEATWSSGVLIGTGKFISKVLGKKEETTRQWQNGIMQSLKIEKPPNLCKGVEQSKFPIPDDNEFDSVTDTHTMHIVYKNEKVYPAYLIQFE